MHRTQLLLEDWQYESLRARAEREGTSLASLVREALAVYLTEERTAAERRLAEIEGIGSDGEARGREHDRFLYGGG